MNVSKKNILVYTKWIGLTVLLISLFSSCVPKDQLVISEGVLIPEDQITIVQNEHGVTVYNISIGRFQSGYNYTSTPSGKRMYINYDKGGDSEYFITNNKGKILGSFAGKAVGVDNNFICSSTECACLGNSDCNDMFSSNKCSDIAVCYSSGNAVICICWKI